MLKSSYTLSRGCGCGDEKYCVKSVVSSIYLNESMNDECDIFSLVEKIQSEADVYKPIKLDLAEKIVRRSKEEMMNLRFEQRIDSVAKIDKNEVKHGRKLGTGGFSSVYELSSLNLNEKVCKTFSAEDALLRRALVFDLQARLRQKMPSPFAVKHLRRKLVRDPNRFANGAIDLILEAAILSRLDHPNILKLHGVAAEGPGGYLNGRHDSFFLILDRLAGTLQDRIISWRKQHKILVSTWSRQRERKKKLSILLMSDRLNVAANIAAGLCYLHSRRLIYRDLKPTNIGFGLDGSVKLFDFGLCRELPLGADTCFDAVYDMSGGVGTYRYMSPEVANRTKYNQGTDVFSFGLVLFEILSLNQPKVEEGCRTVNQAHLRFCHCWPISVTSLLRQALSPVIAERPTMEEIHKVLLNQIRVLDERLRELNTNGSKAAGVRKMLPQLRLDDESVDTLSISTIGMQDAM